MADEEKTDDQNNETEEEKNLHENNKVTIEDSGSCKKKITVEIPEETIKTSLDEQYQDLRKEAVVPGFRKGRAPLRLVEKRFGSEIGLQVKLKLLADASQAAIDANKLDILGDPDIDHEKVDLPETGPMKFDYEVEVRPDFELPELEGIAVEKPSVEVTDEQIDEEIMAMRNRAGVWAPREEGAIVENDQIVADVVMVIEDVEDVTQVFRVMKNVLQGKIAILTRNTAVLTIAKLVSLLVSKENLELEVFCDIGIAKEWLGVE